IVPAVEPVGASEPSPFPGEQVYDGVPNLCLTPDAADSDGRITERVTFESELLEPAPGVTSRFTAAEILQRFHTDEQTRGYGGDAKAYFGRLTDDYGNPFPKARPLWVVVVCGSPEIPSAGGGLQVPPTPAPGTSPSPGGRYLGIISVPYDENGHVLGGETISNYPDAVLRAEQLFEVPFERNQQDAMAGRQVGLTYKSDDSCATFDHLEVQEPQDGSVYVQVWLRLLPGHDSCTALKDPHDVTIGLRTALGERALLRGVAPR
ncbi:MAG: hypothetical protein JWO12_3163, partial [Frankiales bacterium]|nr:hypothetical protein [Frankiales bacterium]